jgi:hypothetical protein
MNPNEVVTQLKTITLPGNCKCGDPVCQSTWDFRFSHAQRDAVKEAITFYLNENDFTVIGESGPLFDQPTNSERNL